MTNLKAKYRYIEGDAYYYAIYSNNAVRKIQYSKSSNALTIFGSVEDSSALLKNLEAEGAKKISGIHSLVQKFGLERKISDLLYTDLVEMQNFKYNLSFRIIVLDLNLLEKQNNNE